MKCRVCAENAELYDVIKDNVINLTNFYNKPCKVEKVDIEVYECPYCGHVQIKSLLGDSYYDDYNITYNPKMDEKEDENEKFYPTHLLEYYKKCFQIMSDLSKERKRVLDIGCATGDITVMLKDMYETVVGVEPSKKMSAVARRKGIEVVNDYFTDKLELEPFDSVSCCMVLEHVDDLNAFMRGLSKALKEDGIAMINVPNGEKIVNSQSYSDIYLENINYFTPQSLLQMAYKYGFVVKRMVGDEFGDGFHLTVWIQKKEKNKLFSVKKEEDAQEIVNILKEYHYIGVFGIGIRARNILNLIPKESGIKYLFDNNSFIAGKYVLDYEMEIQVPDKESIQNCDLILITSLEYYQEIIAELLEKYQYKGNILYIEDGNYVLYKR